MPEALKILLEILLVLALVAGNAFFVAAEFALVKIRASQLRPMARTGGWRVRLALFATEHLDAVLSSTQLGITLTSLGLGWIGEPVIGHRLEPLLGHFGVTEPAAIKSISFAVAFSVITFLHIVLGELAPKSLAIQRPKVVSLNVAGPLVIFYRVFFPVIWLLNGAANRILRWGGLEPASEGEHAFSSEELEYVFSQARHAHPGDALINRIMVRSLRLRTVTAQQVMRPRDQVVALFLDRPVAENLRLAQTAGFSRFPVCTGSLDDVKGIVLMREWLWQIQLLGARHLLRATRAPDPHLHAEDADPHHDRALPHLARPPRHRARCRAPDRRHREFRGRAGGDRRRHPRRTRPRPRPGLRPRREPHHRQRAFHHARTAGRDRLGLRLAAARNVATWAERQRGQPLKKGEAFVVGDYRVTATEVSADNPRRLKVERLPAERK
jgi:hypothetical protein